MFLLCIMLQFDVHINLTQLENTEERSNVTG